MEEYTGFAEVYDLFMDDVPYEKWHRHLHSILNSHAISEGLILDLGCGTGKMTRLLSEDGYDMIGLDLSEEMLAIAQKKEQERQDSILYLNQDMREFELYGTVKAIVSICDSINYITDEKDLLHVFELVNNYLDPGGLFIFDFNTIYKYEEILGDQTICENREEGSFIWDNYYNSETMINMYDMTFYIKDEDGRYSRYDEMHFQKAYRIETLRRFIEEAGLEFLSLCDEEGNVTPPFDAERVYVIAREKQKTMQLNIV
ncbi:MAG: class I SAM-dependent DNA methyltransferase [Lachnospiraceae bacterium]